MPKIENKDAVLFWLKRRLREIEAKCQMPEQEMMAERGVPYSERSRAIQAAVNQADAAKVELKAYKDAVAFIEENG